MLSTERLKTLVMKQNFSYCESQTPFGDAKNMVCNLMGNDIFCQNKLVKGPLQIFSLNGVANRKI